MIELSIKVYWNGVKYCKDYCKYHENYLKCQKNLLNIE